MRRLPILTTFCAAFVLTHCNSTPTGTSTYVNKLTLGTGIGGNGFSLVNEGTSFTRLGGTVNIYFRLESAADMGGSPVALRIERNTAGNLMLDTTWTYANPQSYGHIFLSSFSMSSAGSFKATGILNSTMATVASCDFTVQ